MLSKFNYFCLIKNKMALIGVVEPGYYYERY